MSRNHSSHPNRQPERAALLDQHRRDIEALDRRILHLVCERLEVARDVGAIKSELGVPLRNFEVEEQVHRRFEEAGSYLGLDSVLARDLALFLIEKAVEAQAFYRDTVYRGDALETVVVGGKGGMGRWFVRFLAGQGHRVRVVDPGPGDSDVEEVDRLEDVVPHADLVMVAVPMSRCREVLERIAALRPNGVVAEMCSLKGHLSDFVSGLRSDGMRLVSFHPMFGPDVRMLSGRTVVFCTEAPDDDLAVVRGLFERTSARLVDMDSTEHDRRMGVVLGLTHLTNLVFARALERSGVNAGSTAEVAGVTYHKQIATTREVTEENPQLYFEIQALNAGGAEVGDLLRQSLDEWLAAARGGAETFASIMEDCQRHFDEG